jgi:hypothetical protein
MSNLPPGRELLISNLITGLRADLGVRRLNEVLDFLYIFAQSSQANALLNWAQDLYNPVQTITSGTMPFTVDQGFARVSGTNYIDSNFNPVLQSGNYQPNSNSAGIYLRTDQAGGNTCEMSCCDASHLGPLFIRVRSSTNGFDYSAFGANQFPTTGPTNGITSSLGMYSVRRQNNVVQECYWNGSLLYTDRKVPTGFTGTSRGNIIIGFAPVSGIGTTKQMAAAWAGNGTFNHDIIYRRIQEYLLAIGSAV